MCVRLPYLRLISCRRINHTPDGSQSKSFQMVREWSCFVFEMSVLNRSNAVELFSLMHIEASCICVAHSSQHWFCEVFIFVMFIFFIKMSVFDFKFYINSKVFINTVNFILFHAIPCSTLVTCRGKPLI